MWRVLKWLNVGYALPIYSLIHFTDTRLREKTDFVQKGKADRRLVTRSRSQLSQTKKSCLH